MEPSLQLPRCLILKAKNTPVAQVFPSVGSKERMLGTISTVTVCMEGAEQSWVLLRQPRGIRKHNRDLKMVPA